MHNPVLVKELNGLQYKGVYGTRTADDDVLVTLHQSVEDQTLLVQRKRDNVVKLRGQLDTLNDIVSSVFEALGKDAKVYLKDTGMDNATIEELQRLTGPTTIFGAMQRYWFSQLGKSRTTVSYPPMLLHFALLVHNTHPAAARRVRAGLPLMFPSETTLRRHNNTKESSSGICEHGLKVAWDLSNAPTVSDSDRIGVVENDDVSIQEVSARFERSCVIAMAGSVCCCCCAGAVVQRERQAGRLQGGDATGTGKAGQQSQSRLQGPNPRDGDSRQRLLFQRTHGCHLVSVCDILHQPDGQQQAVRHGVGSGTVCSRPGDVQSQNHRRYCGLAPHKLGMSTTAAYYTGNSRGVCVPPCQIMQRILTSPWAGGGRPNTVNPSLPWLCATPDSEGAPVTLPDTNTSSASPSTPRRAPTGPAPPQGPPPSPITTTLQPTRRARIVDSAAQASTRAAVAPAPRPTRGSRAVAAALAAHPPPVPPPPAVAADTSESMNDEEPVFGLALVEHGTVLRTDISPEYRKLVQDALRWATYSPHPLDPHALLIHIGDPPHVVRNGRNHFDASTKGGKRRMVKVVKESDGSFKAFDISMTHVREAYQYSQEHHFSCTSPLTFAAVNLTNFSKMAMAPLLALLDPRTVELIRCVYRDHPEVFSSDPSATIEFLEDMHVILHCLTSKGAYKYGTVEDKRLLQLAELVTKMEAQRRLIAEYAVAKHIPSADAELLHLPRETFDALKACVYGFILLVYQETTVDPDADPLQRGNSVTLSSPLRLACPNNDHLEHHFGNLRQASAETNPPALRVLQTTTIGVKQYISATLISKDDKKRKSTAGDHSVTPDVLRDGDTQRKVRVVGDGPATYRLPWPVAVSKGGDAPAVTPAVPFPVLDGAVGATSSVANAVLKFLAMVPSPLARELESEFRAIPSNHLTTFISTILDHVHTDLDKRSAHGGVWTGWRHVEWPDAGGVHRVHETVCPSGGTVQCLGAVLSSGGGRLTDQCHPPVPHRVSWCSERHHRQPPQSLPSPAEAAVDGPAAGHCGTHTTGGVH